MGMSSTGYISSTFGTSDSISSVVRSVVRYAIARGCEAFAVFEGYEGLVQGGKLIKQMHWGDVRGWLSEGGTLSMCPCLFIIPYYGLSFFKVEYADF